MAYTFNPFTGELDYFVSGAGTGNVSGGSASASGELAKYTDTTGKAIGRSYLIFSGLATTARTKTISDANDTLLELAGSYTPTGTWDLRNMTVVSPPTWNQDTTGSASSVKAAGTTGKITITGPGAGITRVKTLRDADDTIMEQGGTYTPTGTWNFSFLSIAATPTWNQDTQGAAASLTIAGQSGKISFTGLTSTNRTKTVRDANDTLLELAGSYTPTGTWNFGSATVTGLPSSGIGGSTGSTDKAILTANGTGGSTISPSGVTIDSSNNISTTGTITCTGINIPKVSSTAGQDLLYSDHSTDTTGAGWMGPHSASGMANSYYLQLPESEPTNGQVLTAATPSAHVSTLTWSTPAGGLPSSPSAGDIAYYNGSAWVNTHAFAAEYNNGNSGSAVTITWSNAFNQNVTLSAATPTLTMASPPFPCHLTLKVIQDSGGNRIPTITPSPLYSNGIAPTWSTAGGAKDILSLYYDGSNYYGGISISNAS